MKYSVETVSKSYELRMGSWVIECINLGRVCDCVNDKANWWFSIKFDSDYTTVFKYSSRQSKLNCKFIHSSRKDYFEPEGKTQQYTPLEFKFNRLQLGNSV